MNFSISIIIGDTNKNSVVFDIAKMQEQFFKRKVKNVFFNKNTESDINIYHKYGILPKSNCLNIFYFHFDPFDIRHDCNVTDILNYFKLFDLIVCINKKQLYFCELNGFTCLLLNHGSTYGEININVDHRCNIYKPNIALIADHYNNNVKGDSYFSLLSQELNTNFNFYLIGRGWDNKYKNIKTVNALTYKDILKIMKYIDILYIGGRYEAGPASYPDMVNCNKYIFSTRVGMVNDNFIDGKSGFFITYDMKEDSKNLLTLKEKIIKNELPEFKNYYLNWDCVLQNIFEVMNECIQKKNKKINSKSKVIFC